MATFPASTRSPSAGYPRAERRRAGKRRSALLLLTVCLLLATGLALLGAGAALTDAGVAVPISDRAALPVELAGAFYAAVDDAVRTGNADALDAIVAPDVVWCLPCTGQAPGREGLKRSLAGLHETAPEARLVVESVVAVSQDTVTARLRVAAYPLVAEPLLWGPVETLHLAGGMVVERRIGPDGLALVDPLLRARLGPLPPAVTGLALSRLTFAPGAGVTGLLSAGPTLLVVEAGALAVYVPAQVTIVRAAADDGEGAAGNGESVDTVLRQGDAAIVPAGVRHALLHRGMAPALVLGVTLVFDGARSRHHSAGPADAAPFVPSDRSAPELMEGRSLPDVRILASGAVGAWSDGPVEVALGRVVLGPGTGIASSGGEVVLLSVEAGTVNVASGEERMVAAGDGEMRPAGTTHELRNAGDGVLVLLAVTVAAVGE